MIIKTYKIKFEFVLWFKVQPCYPLETIKMEDIGYCFSATSAREIP